MDELLFTGDDVKRYEDNPYLFEIVNPGDRQKADAIKQYLKNQRAINWLEHGYYDESCQEKDNYYSGLTIAAALEWYEKYQEYWADSNFSELQLPQQETKNYWLRRNNSTEIGVEIVDNEPEDTTDWKKIVGAVKSDDPIPRAKLAKIIRKNPASIKTILAYHPNFDKAVEALSCWNLLMPRLVNYDEVEKREHEDTSKPEQTQETAAPAEDQKVKKPDSTPKAPTFPEGFPRKGVHEQVVFVLKNILPKEDPEILKLLRITVSGVSTLHYNGQPFTQQKYVEGELYNKAFEYVKYEFTTRKNFYSHFKKLKSELILEQYD